MPTQSRILGGLGSLALLATLGLAQEPSGVWTEVQKLLPSDREAGDYFGWLAAFGTGTPGCSGTQTLWATRPPELGMAGMAFTCDNAPPSSAGTLIVGDAADGVGSDLLGLGVLMHVDLLASNFLILVPMFSDAGGEALTPSFSVPSNPNFAGFELQAQSLWIWSTCALPPNGLSTSRGLTVRLLAP